jgi:hypothetical protein
VDFAQDELMRFVSRFKDTLRSIDLIKITIGGGAERKEWTSFIDWLQNNIPNLENFNFQGLLYSYEQVVCFDSIFNDPEPSFKSLIYAPWESYTKLPGGNGTLVLGIPDSIRDDSCAFLEIDVFFTKLGRGGYGLDNNPPRNSQVYTVGFEGSKSGAQEALGLVLRAAAVQTVRDPNLHTTPRHFSVPPGILM